MNEKNYEELCEKYVNYATKKGVDDAIALIEETNNMQVRFSNNDIDIINNWHSLNTNVYLSKGKKQIITELEGNENGKIENKIYEAIKKLSIIPENKNYGGITKGEKKYSPYYYSKDIEDIKNLVDVVRAAINSALNEGAKSVAGTFYVYNTTRYLHSSAGPHGKDKSNAVTLSVRAFMNSDSSGHWVSAQPQLSMLKPEEVGGKAAQIAKDYKNPKEGKEGVYDIILAPLFGGSLISNLASMTSAFWADAGQSIFSNKLNEKVAPDFVTMYDYADSNTISRRIFDDEGSPIKKTVWLDKGVYKTHLHNTSTAKKYNVETTSNAGLIDPSPFFTYVEPGDSYLEEMIAETKHGLYMVNTWYSRYTNMYTGEFSTIPRDAIFLIENGQIKESYKGIRVSDNISNMLKNISMLSKDRYQVEWWGEVEIPCTVPYMKINNVRITKSQ
jgi:PmbA protein